ncbi:hypothetical protein ASE01_15850 [Nocardioides sp. Root190]|uniref:hypothetical protein n=1 Tax=Nocardioides sp. Root190 TaxID=1736488 RepID=UPI0006FE2564|nr:hypothetical protein [Nocardioides sp. Root190]KRB76436.1 hypothetical protein ASE01_15850 [Nocardioides sp. Root190]
MSEEIVEASPEQVMAVIEQMPDLPWPEGEEWLEWEIDGLEGQTSYLMHVLPLAATTDAAALAAYTSRLTWLADKRWVARFRFDATLFTDDADTDPASYDRRSAPASLVRSLDADNAAWWPRGENAVMLVVSAEAAETKKAAVLVLPSQWLKGPPPTAYATTSPLVADFLSGDKDRVIPALWAVMKTRDPEVLTPLAHSLRAIERATANVELGGMLASNGSHLAHALDRVALFDKRVCLCTAYPSHQFYDPDKEEAQQHVRILDRVPNERQWVPDRICECRDCGRKYQVEQGEYHYTWWKWTEVATDRDR